MGISTTTALSILTDNVLTPIGEFLTSAYPYIFGLAIVIFLINWGWRKFKGASRGKA